MNTTICLKIKKEVDTPTARKILKLKGNLIAQSFTDIIYFDDEGEDFYIHHFAIDSTKLEKATSFILSYIENEDISSYVIIL